MPKLPYMQFYVSDWLSDYQLALCSLSTRGLWLELLCGMHTLDHSGVLTGTAEQLARVCRCQVVEFVRAVDELQAYKVADVSKRDDVYTVVCRRMKREYKEMMDAKKRQSKYLGAKNAIKTENKRKINAAGSVSDVNFNTNASDVNVNFETADLESSQSDFEVKTENKRKINAKINAIKTQNKRKINAVYSESESDINMNNSNELFFPKQSETDCNSGTKKPRNFQIWFDYEGDCRIHGITPERLALWKENFPAVDVEQELRSASAWLDGNRTNRKYNVSRFLVNWLSRSQDRARIPQQAKTNQAQKPQFTEEDLDEFDKYFK